MVMNKISTLLRLLSDIFPSFSIDKVDLGDGQKWGGGYEILPEELGFRNCFKLDYIR